MKTILFTLIFGLVACSSFSDNQNQKKKSFLNQFKEINGNGFHIYSHFENKIYKDFEGVKIDSSNFSFISNGSFIPNFEEVKSGRSEIHACYKFKLADSLYGLIIRGQSQYDESSIDLLIWNLNTCKIVNVINLADEFGDEGWYFNQEAWIELENNVLNIIIRKKDHNPSENENQFTVSDTIKYFKFSGNEFIIYRPEILDSSKYKQEFWK